jgi:hypothetical protein
MPAADSQSSTEPISWSRAEAPRAVLIAAFLLFFLTLCLGCSAGTHPLTSGAASTAGSGASSGSGSNSGSTSGSGSGNSGSGNSGSSNSGSGNSQPAPLVLSPASATIQTWQTIQFSLSGQSSDAACVWTSSSTAILPSIADQTFQGQQTGNATVSVTCGSQSAQAVIAVIPQAASGPITITSGGTYSGNWNSNDAKTPAVTIATDQPVILEDSTVTGRGNLIQVTGVSTGANVTIENVTGTALDPQVAGQQRGQFVSASKISSLVVQNCTMTGVSFGVNALNSSVSMLQILNNKAVNLEDRASDGQGGLLNTEPNAGHFILLNSIAAPAGAEIAWNQVVQTMGQSSTTDVINIYRSQGSAGHPIWIHDNFIYGDSSPVSANFSGVGIIADGGKTAPVTAFARFENNEIVHTAGSGVAIANGHDVTVTGNRMVSCGRDASGQWYAASSAVGVYLWDVYATGPSLYYNNTVTQSAGGLVRLGSSGTAVASDAWGSAASLTYPGNSMSGNSFTDPCLANGQLNSAAEDAERAYWTSKVAAAGEAIGDQHNAAE